MQTYKVTRFGVLGKRTILKEGQKAIITCQETNRREAIIIFDDGTWDYAHNADPVPEQSKVLESKVLERSSKKR